MEERTALEGWGMSWLQAGPEGPKAGEKGWTSPNIDRSTGQNTEIIIMSYCTPGPVNRRVRPWFKQIIYFPKKPCAVVLFPVTEGPGRQAAGKSHFTASSQTLHLFADGKAEARAFLMAGKLAL